MNATRNEWIFRRRSAWNTGFGVGLLTIVLSGCGAGMSAPLPPMISSVTPSTQQSVGPNANPGHPQLSFVAGNHLFTIKSDVAGSTQPVYFNVELFVDSDNRFQLLNVHRLGGTRFATPQDGSEPTPAVRERICRENSEAYQENCDVDLDQLTRTGVVIERLLGREGVVLKAKPGFSAADGGELTLTYMDRGDVHNHAENDTHADYGLQLLHRNSRWLMYGPQGTQKAPFTFMKLNSRFASLFAIGIESIELGDSEQ
jgi:hypothetical protein